jgi:DNA processing protein
MDTTAFCEESRAALRLLICDGIGHARLRALRLRFGGACAALEAHADDVAAAIGVTPESAARLLRDARCTDLEGALSALVTARMRPILEDSADYPQLLRASHDPPALLLASGQLTAVPEPAVAIVGSRRATAYGRIHAGALAVALAERGITVVSGGARGIDAEAHRGALRANGRTIAVLATGCAHPYPSEHAELFSTIAASGGCLVSEQPPFITARPDLFPRRNRIIAALSLVTVVVEAATRSGALLTARIAVDDLGREAGCLPGPVDSATSAGCHRAIREGWAQLVTSADDICELIANARTVAHGARELAARAPMPVRLPRKPAEVAGSAPALKCSDDARSVLAAIRAERQAGLDELERVLGWSVPRLARATLELEVAGAIARDAQGAFVLRGS